MTTIVDTLRKQKKMIVLGAALAVITLYIIPVDQIASALQGIDNAISHIQATRDRLAIRLADHQDIFLRVDAHLAALQQHLSDTAYRIENT